jgi:hypothetical protein
MTQNVPSQIDTTSYSAGHKPGREADHSPPCSAEVKKAWSYTSTPLKRPHGAVLN